MKQNHEPETGDKDVYIKIEPFQAIELKRTLLEISASNVKMQMTADRFKEKSRDEIRERGLAKRHMREASEMIHNLVLKLPKVNEIHHTIRKHSMDLVTSPGIKPLPIEPVRKDSPLMKELEDIRRKISSL